MRSECAQVWDDGPEQENKSVNYLSDIKLDSCVHGKILDCCTVRIRLKAMARLSNGSNARLKNDYGGMAVGWRSRKPESERLGDDKVRKRGFNLGRETAI